MTGAVPFQAARHETPEPRVRVCCSARLPPSQGNTLTKTERNQGPLTQGTCTPRLSKWATARRSKREQRTPSGPQAGRNKTRRQAKKVLRREAVEHKQFLDTLFIAVRFFGKRFPRQVVANPHRAEVNAPWRGAEEE